MEMYACTHAGQETKFFVGVALCHAIVAVQQKFTMKDH